jgi:hypothetical protein
MSAAISDPHIDLAELVRAPQSRPTGGTHDRSMRVVTPGASPCGAADRTKAAQNVVKELTR